MTDEDLMLAFQRGSRDAFDALFDRYRQVVWGFFKRRTADTGTAEELTQDAFLAVLQNTHRYEPRASFRGYLFGIAFNILSASRRKARRDAVSPLDGVDPAAAVADPTSVLWVRRALAELDDSDRDILMLREYEQLSYDDIASLLDVPVNTVRSRLFRARTALRARLVPQSEGGGPR